MHFTWCTSLGPLLLVHHNCYTSLCALYSVHFTWCTSLGALHLVHFTWCTSLGALHLVHFTWFTWCTSLGALHLVQFTWCTSLGALHLVHFTWYTSFCVGLLRQLLALVTYFDLLLYYLVLTYFELGEWCIVDYWHFMYLALLGGGTVCQGIIEVFCHSMKCHI